jgi:hypothetical protein
VLSSATLPTFPTAATYCTTAHCCAAAGPQALCSSTSTTTTTTKISPRVSQLLLFHQTPKLPLDSCIFEHLTPNSTFQTRLYTSHCSNIPAIQFYSSISSPLLPIHPHFSAPASFSWFRSDCRPKTIPTTVLFHNRKNISSEKRASLQFPTSNSSNPCLPSSTIHSLHPRQTISKPSNDLIRNPRLAVQKTLPRQ